MTYDSNLEACFVELLITPQNPCCLAGYAGRAEPWRDIETPLFLSGLYLVSKSEKLLILSADVLYFPIRALGHVLKEIPSDIKVLTFGTHTHFAPALDDRLLPLGKVDPNYLQFFQQQATRLVRDILQMKREKVSFEYAEVSCKAAINRRLFPKGFHWMNLFNKVQAEMRPNFLGEIDDKLRLLKIQKFGSQEVMAVLTGLSCHPTSMPRPNSVGADYPFFLRRKVAESFPHAGTIFFQGFSGDLRPRALDFQNNLFIVFNDAEYSHWLESEIGSSFDSALENFHKVPSTLFFAESRVGLDLIADFPISAGFRKIDIALMNLGSFLSFVMVAGEPLCSYVRIIQDIMSPSKVWPVGCFSDSYGYLPDCNSLKEGGYEVEGFFEVFFSAKGRFKPSVEEHIKKEIKKLKHFVC